jgi:hypothetical protein
VPRPGAPIRRPRRGPRGADDRASSRAPTKCSPTPIATLVSARAAVSWRPLLPRALRVPDGGGMVRCPLPDHDDAYASCQVFADTEQGWWCFGCSRGGRIYDLASLMAGGAWRRELAARRSGRYVSWWRRRSADAGCQRVGQAVATCTGAPRSGRRDPAPASGRRHEWGRRRAGLLPTDAGAAREPMVRRRTPASRGMKLSLGGLLSAPDRTVGRPGRGPFWENAGWAGRLWTMGFEPEHSRWPPLRLARLCRKHVSVCVVCPPVLPSVIDPRRLR